MPTRKKRSKTGQALSAERTSPEAVAALEAFVLSAKARNALDEWRRGIAMREYIAGRPVVEIAKQLQVVFISHRR